MRKPTATPRGLVPLLLSALESSLVQPPSLPAPAAPAGVGGEDMGATTSAPEVAVDAAVAVVGAAEEPGEPPPTY